jgi:hypothetical protein
MDKKLMIKTALDKLNIFAKKLGNLLIVAIAMITGFFIGYYYWVMMNQTKTSPLKNINPLTKTSVAINERNELLIIDRATGTYTVYQDSVGLMIFNLYASKKYDQIVK